MRRRGSTSFWSGLCVALMGLAALIHAQSRITPPENKYTPAQDVELGLQAAAEARQELPIMTDAAVTSYVEDMGQRLVAALPNNLRHPEFKYAFQPVNVSDINAFALPGGPMFVNRGMLEAANTEGEVAGVMAHELSHVVLRHGTAQASKAAKYELGQIAGAILGSIIGGRVGSVVAQGTQFGLGASFLRFGREYERQADIEGAEIMARAGYDPRAMAAMFKTIEKKSGGGGPEWLSNHPNPGNRADYILKEAATLQVRNPVRDTGAFERVRARLRSLPPAPTTEEAMTNAKRGGGTSPAGSEPRMGGRVEAPSTRFVKYDEGGVFTVSVPSNWRERPSSSAVTFAPDGAYGAANGQSVFSHGIEFGIAGNEAHDLPTATDELVAGLAQSNPRLSRPSSYRRTSVGGRPALQTTLTNVSDATGRPEAIQLVTTELPGGDLFYSIAVAPDNEARSYQPVFQKIIGSLKFMN